MNYLHWNFVRNIALAALQVALLTAVCTSGAQAGTFNPTMFDSLGALRPFAGSALEFDTDALTVRFQSFQFPAITTHTLHGVAIAQESGPDVAVFAFSDVFVSAGTGITVVGSRPLALLSTGSVEILSSIDVAGREGDPGAGGAGGGAAGDFRAGFGPGAGGASRRFSDAENGAGGGGFGGRGDSGSSAATAFISASGLGGGSYGDLRTALQGGSGGGASTLADGGGGGGAIEIVALEALTLAGIDARGGSGGVGAGAGSGGGITLAGRSIAIAGQLDASGGTSEPSLSLNVGEGGSGGGGRILLAPGEYTWGDMFATNVAPGVVLSLANSGVVTLAPELTVLRAGQMEDLAAFASAHPFAAHPEVEFVLRNLGIAAGAIGYATGPHTANGGVILNGGLLATPGGLDLDQYFLRGYGTQVGRLHVGRDSLLLAEGGNLVVGDANINGALSFDGEVDIAAHSTLVLNQADVVHLRGPSVLADGARLVSINGAELDAGRIMEVAGRALVQGEFINQGSIRVASEDSSLTFLNDVRGAGDFVGDVNFHAGYSPGNSPATIAFGGGDARFDETAELVMEIAGSPQSGDYDRLIGIDTLDFRGLLKLVFSNGYTPAPGDEFHLFDFQHFNGSLAADRIMVVGLDAARLNLSHLAIDGRLSAVPLPGALWPLGLACVALARRRRR